MIKAGLTIKDGGSGATLVLPHMAEYFNVERPKRLKAELSDAMRRLEKAECKVKAMKLLVSEVKAELALIGEA